MKKILKILKYIILIGLLIFIIILTYKYSNFYRLYKIKKDNLAKENIKIEIKYYDDSDVENTRTAIFKDDQALMQSKTSSSEEYKATNTNYTDTLIKMYFFSNNNIKLSEFVVVDELKKTFSIQDTAKISYFSMIEALYPSVDEVIYLEANTGISQELWVLFLRIPEILQMKFYNVEDNGKEAFVSEGERYSSNGADDRDYTRRRVYYDKATMLPYKVTKVKKDGTEKILEEYEITIGNVSDADVALPDLIEYSQIN